MADGEAQRAAAPKYAVGQTLLTISKKDGLPYEAKVMSIKEVKGKMMYVMHFVGWNTRFDEKIAVEDEAAKLFDMSVEEYKERFGLPDNYVVPAKEETKKGAAGRKSVGGPQAVANAGASTSGGPAPGSAPPKTKKTLIPNKRERSMVPEGSASPTTSESVVRIPSKNPLDQPVNIDDQYKLVMPNSLRKILIDDYDLVHRGFITRVPADHTIDKIIADYLKEIPVNHEDLGNQDLTIEYDDSVNNSTNLCLVLNARGVVDYFNVVLGFQLLYKFEKPQYNELVQEKTKKKGIRVGVMAAPENGFRASQYYGLIHLLRMIGHLPRLLKISAFNDHLVERIMGGVTDLLVFLNKHHHEYYREAAEYEMASLEYHRRANQVEPEGTHVDFTQPSTSSSSSSKPSTSSRK